MALRKSLVILIACFLVPSAYCRVVAQIGTEVDGESLLSTETRSTVRTETPTNHTLVWAHLDRRVITRVVVEYENMEEVTTVSSMNYADNMMQVTLIAAHHNILTVQVTIYGFLEPRIISTRDQPSEPVAFKIVPHTQQV